MIFIVLLSHETVRDTVQCSYFIFSLLYHLLRIRLKHQNPLLSYVCVCVRERERERERGGERERERESVHCKCTM